jgi:hypothetical protein
VIDAAQASAEHARQAASAAHARARLAAGASAGTHAQAGDAKADAAACQSARSRQFSASNDNGGLVVVVICDGKVKTFTNAASPAALARARQQISQMGLAPSDQAVALKSIDAFKLQSPQPKSNDDFPLQ